MRDSAGTVENSFRDVSRPDEIILPYVVFKAKTKDSIAQLEGFHPEWIAVKFLRMSSGVYRTLGGFDEGSSLYFEDVHFILRAHQAGYALGIEPTENVLRDA